MAKQTEAQRIAKLEKDLEKLTKRFETHGNHGHVEAEEVEETKPEEEKEEE